MIAEPVAYDYLARKSQNRWAGADKRLLVHG